MAMETHSISGPSATSFVFGPFRLFPTRRLLAENGKPVNLGSRAFDILVALLERAGGLVSKDELMATVWPNTCVEPANLAVHISALRRVLGDGRGGSRYVVNIPGRGYCFVAPVTVEKDVPLEAVAPASLPQQTLVELVPQMQNRRLRAIVGPIDDIGKSAPCPHCHRAHDDGVWLVNLRQGH